MAPGRRQSSKKFEEKRIKDVKGDPNTPWAVGLANFGNVCFEVFGSILSIILATFHYSGNVYFEVFERILLAMFTLTYSKAYVP